MNTKTNYLIALSAFILSAFNGFSATCTWVGSVNAAWGNAANWSGSAVPGSGDDVVINNASATYQPELYFSTTVNSLSVSAGTFNMTGNTLTVATASFTGGTTKDGTINANDFIMSNARFEGLLIFYKIGGGNNDMNGGNTFIGPIAFVNNDDSRWRFATNSPDDFQGICHFEETSSGDVQPAYNGNSTFSGDISTNGSSSTVTFAAGNGQVIITGYTTVYGSPDFNRLTLNTTGQIGFQENKSINELRMIAGTLDLNSNTITVANAFFTGGEVTDGTLSVTDIQTMAGATFTGPLTINKTGGSDNILAGGNTFNSNVTLINSSSALLRLANTTGDDYNGLINFRENSSGQLEPAYNGNNTFSSDISTNNTNNPVTFGAGSGIVVIDGSVFQNFVGNAQMPIINKLTINKNGSFYINNLNIMVSGTLSFTSGIILTGTNREVIFGDDAIHTGAKNASHISGPVTKRGNDEFVFPVGDGTLYAPIAITAPSSTGDAFTAQYFNTPYVNTSSLGAGLNNVSTKEYWILNRTTGSSNVSVTMYFNSSRSGGITQQTDLRVARWNGAQWVSHGNGGTSGTNADGNVISSAAITSFSPFTLGSSTTLNPLPVHVLNFNALPLANSVKVIWSTTSELNNDYFILEKSLDGKIWNELGRVEGAENTNTISNYSFIDNQPVLGTQFYRLKQVDMNGEYTYSNIASARFTEEIVTTVNISPNPANDKSTITLLNNEDENASLKLLNSIGQTVMSFENISSSFVNLELNNLPSGIYQLQVVQNGLLTTTKLIKN